MCKYFFIDYDNTLFSHWTHRIPESALQTVIALQEAGHRVFLASGRSFQGDVSETFGKNFVPDGLVSANGAFLEIHGKVLSEIRYDLTVQNRLIDFVQERNYCMMARHNGIWYVTNKKRLMERRKNLPAEEIPAKSDEQFNELRNTPMLSFFLDDTEEAIVDLEKHFPELKLLRMGKELGGADVIPRENGKAEGMKRMIKYFHASLDDTVAIGDSMNDIEMIRTAAIGIAMGNAMQEVKEAADYVARDIDDDGIQDAVQYALGLSRD